MSDDCGHDHDEPKFVTAEQLRQLQYEAMEAHRLQSEEYALATRSLCFESDEEHLRTVLRILSSIADANDPSSLANYFQGLVAGALGAREWMQTKDVEVTVPEEFGSVAEERFGRHEFVPDSDVRLNPGNALWPCAICNTPQGNAAHHPKET